MFCFKTISRGYESFKSKEVREDKEASEGNDWREESDISREEGCWRIRQESESGMESLLECNKCV